MSLACGGSGLRSADFERALSSRPCARSEHFVLHHVPCAMRSAEPELSTEEKATAGLPVEDCCRFGLVVPKRHARRAVTRSLIKRQARAGFEAAAARLWPGDWLLRLRSPYPIDEFVSAASAPLRTRVRQELAALFAGAGGARR